MRAGGRAVECTSLENWRGGNSTGGSNPSPPATSLNQYYGFAFAGHAKFFAAHHPITGGSAEGRLLSGTARRNVSPMEYQKGRSSFVLREDRKLGCKSNLHFLQRRFLKKRPVQP